jgi:hypothetical protein
MPVIIVLLQQRQNLIENFRLFLIYFLKFIFTYYFIVSFINLRS